LKISSNEGIQLPISLGTKNVIFNQLKILDIFSGIYIGIMMVMIFYNLFIYFSVKDKSYLFYVIYIILVLLVQTGLQGYLFQYIWFNSPAFSQYSIFLFPSLVGVAGMVFMNVFLKAKDHYKKLHLITYILSALYLIPIITPFFKLYNLGYQALSINAGFVSIYMLFMIILILRKGYKPAKYFLVAWVIFLLGVMAFILKDFEILPFNNFTKYTMQIGSAIETVLLSFALAARINDYKREKEISQKQAFDALEKNEHLVREQNIILEQKVEQRTTELNKTLVNLKETQSQLVDAEKMSALGQLTAGVAHEINNPINFVSSNISPLKQDINDLKKIIEKYEEINANSDIPEKLAEIEQLKQQLDYEFLKTELNTIIKGIENGANRTTEIVKSLRNFSRLGENALMLADINEGIDSTLAILKSSASNIDVVKNLKPLPKINCNPGKLNQVLLNVINNALQATKENTTRKEKGKIEIESIDETDNIKITISDNGTGIPDEVKEKIFDPFFTTKKVGDGTGLGLSIAYRIIENHQGQINVESEVNKETTFTIIIPKQ